MPPTPEMIDVAMLVKSARARVVCWEQRASLGDLA